MKAAFFEVTISEKEQIQSMLVAWELHFDAGPFDESKAAEVSDCEVIAIGGKSTVSEAALQKLPRLKLVTTMSTGYDHVDIEACKKHNVELANVPLYGDNTVAEHTFALILGLSHRLVDAVERTKVYGYFTTSGLEGFDLKAKTLGIVGMGHIGQRVAMIAAGFEMKIVAFDVVQSKELASRLGFSYLPLDGLLAKSDVITLHAPYNKHTHHIINKSSLGLMKKSAILINTARGALVDSEALDQALEQGIIAGAGLDVLEDEQLLREEAPLDTLSEQQLRTALTNQILMRKPNVIVTPHNAFNTLEAKQRILDTTIENIDSFSKGKKINIIKA